MTEKQRAPSTDPKVGVVIDGRYKLEKLIGSGAIGTVYRAEQIAVGRAVAVKILKASLAFDPRVRQRFETEARAVAMLRDPNCITLHDFGYDADADILFMVFNYVEGVALDRFVGEAVPLHAALSVVLQVASALDHAHSQGVLHRDLKPANIMMEVTGRGDRARVLDFGLAQIFEEVAPDDGRVTKTGEVYGSPAYMSPEQCRGELTITGASDVYALGVIAFELLEGQLPFKGKPVKLLQSHQYDEVPPLQTDGVPDDVKELVKLMLSKAPEDRPTPADVVQRLVDSVHVDVSLGFALGKDTTELWRGAAASISDESDPETVEFDPAAHLGLGGAESSSVADFDDDDWDDHALYRMFDFAPPRLVEPSVIDLAELSESASVRTAVGLLAGDKDPLTPLPSAELDELLSEAIEDPPPPPPLPSPDRSADDQETIEMSLSELELDGLELPSEVEEEESPGLVAETEEAEARPRQDEPRPASQPRSMVPVYVMLALILVALLWNGARNDEPESVAPPLPEPVTTVVTEKVIVPAAVEPSPPATPRAQGIVGAAVAVAATTSGQTPRTTVATRTEPSSPRPVAEPKPPPRNEPRRRPRKLEFRY